MSYSNNTEPLRVLMMPDYRIDNPYQTLLSNALGNLKIEVLFPSGYRRIFPIYRAIKSIQKINVVHIHWLNPYLKGKNLGTKLIYAIKFLIDIIFTKWTGVKVIWTIHNYISHDSKFPILEQWIQQNLFNLADGIIIHHSLALQENIQNYKFDKSKIYVIPHGHYSEFYGNSMPQIEARKALGIPLTGKVYLNLGMLRPYKGVERLLKVWLENPEFLQESHLLIAGKALDESYLQKLTQLAANTQRVIFHPDFVEDSRVHLFFSAADVVVLPFEKILTSGSLILAMSYNKPIIAPRTDGIAETLGKADWLLYEYQDPQGLWKSLKDSNQIDLEKLSEIVKQECAKLSWNDIGIKTSVIYSHSLRS
ncbi:glycosyltransferase [Anabaena cylindrica FACHB-243]|uniref:Glycosyl transferase group 1 n=1 Tax=Anabaena cylindrica (strain ATCC 27899 / PCC 7122) TaxID=272123 RepID=K9ZIX8_ANACC|nr:MULTISPECIES: glycosyltransferase [Anabaena]AFZ59166.1 glycosyl transferase group 1 [Anabaena cylindrica PCC 7122]MBD2416516.1 glycosyltransferase [Anabaena cylindrica FACHB-243]MBY5281088.1 glycosyltransferase [Anabaena sp. CCAP 1446/1C]MBY5309875.1 glycosyltransferase [Anabaena sp. CCAP 1446/1C]MCM2407454.1 glycosyltransferase [Anabaena sp. CCAP 1446/1C]